jgi:two-component system chemotaxis sensor kinase CheA
LITVEQANQMADREAVRLIFHPGFSTAEQVSSVSGRGVGMDVVRENIDRLGGSVEIDSVLGRGTRIIIKLPLTLAIIPSLIVQGNDDKFAFPQVSIAELVRVRREELQSRIGLVKSKEVLRLRDKLLPLVRLSEVLNHATFNPRQWTDDEYSEMSSLNIIVVETGRQRYGVIVDGLHDSEKIVVKPLGRLLKDCRCLSGATILGDGRIALILDVNGIAAHCHLHSAEEKIESQDDETKLDNNLQSLLLFTNLDTDRFAVPMPCVARIERIRSLQIDSVGDKLLLQYRGGTLPLLSLEDYVTTAPRAETERLFIIVFSFGEREFGLIAPHLDDICNVSAEVDDSSVRETGIAGAMVINGKTTRLLDIRELARKAFPEWFERDGESDPAESEDRPWVLLAEDSGFFRRQISRFLDDMGCHVVDCEDGLVAWQTLQSLHGKIRLVVTDIEMPNMNGLELCRRIKGDPQLANLPVIALSSLAGDADIRTAEECGVDDYVIKMDQHRLTSVVQRFLTDHDDAPIQLDLVGDMQ